MADVNHVITLGIGTPGDVTHFVLTGLSPAIVYTGVLHTNSRRRIEAMDVQQRAGAYIPSLITLPDGSGYWLFGDGSRIMWGSGDTGEHGEVKRRIEDLTVKNG